MNQWDWFVKPPTFDLWVGGLNNSSLWQRSYISFTHTHTHTLLAGAFFELPFCFLHIYSSLVFPSKVLADSDCSVHKNYILSTPFSCRCRPQPSMYDNEFPTKAKMKEGNDTEKTNQEERKCRVTNVFTICSRTVPGIFTLGFKPSEVHLSM